MNLVTGDYEFNTNLAASFTKDEVLKEIEGYFQRYDIEFRKKYLNF